MAQAVIKVEKRLFEICDYVIDNCREIGDASMEVTGVKGKRGPTFSIYYWYVHGSVVINDD